VLHKCCEINLKRTMDGHGGRRRPRFSHSLRRTSTSTTTR